VSGSVIVTSKTKGEVCPDYDKIGNPGTICAGVTGPGAVRSPRIWSAVADGRTKRQCELDAGRHPVDAGLSVF
jgi:hypothetical protein